MIIHMNNIVCKNLEIRIILKKSFDSTKENTAFRIENKSNLFVVRSSFMKCVFIIYKHTLSTIHVTGIRNKDSINDIVIFLKKYDLGNIDRFIIDNSLFSGRTVKQIELRTIKARLRDKYPFYSASFSEEVRRKVASILSTLLFILTLGISRCVPSTEFE